MHFWKIFRKISQRQIKGLASTMQHKRSYSMRLTIAAGTLRAHSRSVPDALITRVRSRNDIAHCEIGRRAEEVAYNSRAIGRRVLQNADSIAAGRKAVLIENGDRDTCRRVLADGFHRVCGSTNGDGGLGRIKRAEAGKGWRCRRRWRREIGTAGVKPCVDCERSRRGEGSAAAACGCKRVL